MDKKEWVIVIFLMIGIAVVVSILSIAVFYVLISTKSISFTSLKVANANIDVIQSNIMDVESGIIHSMSITPESISLVSQKGSEELNELGKSEATCKKDYFKSVVIFNKDGLTFLERKCDKNSIRLIRGAYYGIDSFGLPLCNTTSTFCDYSGGFGGDMTQCSADRNRDNFGNLDCEFINRGFASVSSKREFLF